MTKTNTAAVPQTNTNPFFAPVNEDGDFERLEDGVYDGVCIGCELREYRDYNDPNAKVRKMSYIFQVALGGQCNYFRSKPMALIIGEKSNLFCFIQSWTGATIEKMAAGFAAEKMIGYPAQLVINTVTGKDGKQYANLANVLKVKKGVQVPVTPDAIPVYLVRNSIVSSLAEGITVKAEEPRTAAPAAAGLPQGLPGGIASAQARPHFQPNQAPQAPANANITQNADAAGFMGVQPQGGEYVPPAAPPLQAPGQSPAQEDSDYDLPF